MKDIKEPGEIQTCKQVAIQTERDRQTNGLSNTHTGKQTRGKEYENAKQKQPHKIKQVISKHTHTGIVK